MNVITVIPLARGLGRDYLSYFTGQTAAPGDLVVVPIRGRSVNALVIEVKPLAEAKTGLRRADFSIKKVSEIKARQFLSPAVIAAAREVADYYSAPLGPTLKHIIPAAIFRDPISPTKTEPALAPVPAASKIKPETLVIQASDEERLSYYKSLVREEFAKKQSVLICEPTLPELLGAKAILEKGIAHYTLVVHGGLSQKALAEAWLRLASETHPLLILATPLGLSLTRGDLSTLIIEREGSPNYRTITRPAIDYRYFAEKLASKHGWKLILGDLLLRPETMRRVELDELWPARPLKQRLPSAGKTRLVTVTSGSIWSDEAKELIEQSTVNNEHLLILANRRGLAPLVICDDCGQAVLCGNCAAPLVLHEAHLFRCHQCGETRTAAEKCRHCGSWRLRALGAGLERVAKELPALAPERPVFQLDSDHIKTVKQAEAVIRKFLASRGAILIGSEMALNYLREKVPHGIIVTIDAMLTLPDFRISERVFRLVARTRATITAELIIQTRQEGNELLQLSARGQLLDYYRNEIELRQKLDYPPFKVFIKITRAGERAENRRLFSAIESRLASYQPVVYPAFHQTDKTRPALNLLLKVKPDNWPEATLLYELRALPPDFVVTVDPESIL